MLRIKSHFVKIATDKHGQHKKVKSHWTSTNHKELGVTAILYFLGCLFHFKTDRKAKYPGEHWSEPHQFISFYCDNNEIYIWNSKYWLVLLLVGSSSSLDKLSIYNKMNRYPVIANKTNYNNLTSMFWLFSKSINPKSDFFKFINNIKPNVLRKIKNVHK